MYMSGRWPLDANSGKKKMSGFLKPDCYFHLIFQPLTSVCGDSSHEVLV